MRDDGFSCDRRVSGHRLAAAVGVAKIVVEDLGLECVRVGVGVCWSLWGCFGLRFAQQIDQHVPGHEGFDAPEAHL